MCMRTGELAARAGINAQTLRYYERRGLLARPARSPPAGYRSYPDEAVAVVRFVKRSQELGFTLDEVAELLRLADGGPPDDCDTARALAESRVAELERRIADLQRMRGSLAELIATCELPPQPPVLSDPDLAARRRPPVKLEILQVPRLPQRGGTRTAHPAGDRRPAGAARDHPPCD